MAEVFKALQLTLWYHSPLAGFESWPVHVEKLPVTYNHLQLASKQISRTLAEKSDDNQNSKRLKPYTGK